eukprot:m.298540 g.298540  ORF g.298540 m.298540 type:complete len:52 (+) comp94362_c0_seq1:65-220(+)
MITRCYYDSQYDILHEETSVFSGSTSTAVNTHTTADLGCNKDMKQQSISTA